MVFTNFEPNKKRRKKEVNKKKAVPENINSLLFIQIQCANTSSVQFFLNPFCLLNYNESIHSLKKEFQ